jgi:predicted nucleotide-binding protein
MSQLPAKIPPPLIGFLADHVAASYTLPKIKSATLAANFEGLLSETSKSTCVQDLLLTVNRTHPKPLAFLQDFLSGLQAASETSWSQLAPKLNERLSAIGMEYADGVIVSRQTSVTPAQPATSAVANSAELDVGGVFDMIFSDTRLARGPATQRSNSQSRQSNKHGAATETPVVFVVHGHDNGLKNTVARFIEKLGLKATLLHEQSDKGRTIIEKLASEGDVDYAVVLCTGDDRGWLAIEDVSTAKPRPRQNVILELGYFLAKPGRDRVCVVREPNVEMPSDVAGVVYATPKDWQIKLLDGLTSSLSLKLDQAQITAALAIQ